MIVDLEKVKELIQDYGKRFTAQIECQRIIQHIEENYKEAVKNEEKTSGKAISAG